MVCLLLVLASAIVFPSIERGLKERELSRAALEIAAVARDLRSRAVYDKSVGRIVFMPAENSYESARGGRVVLSPDVKITGIEGGEPLGDGLRQFLFFPNGSVMGREVEISGRDGFATYLVRIDALTGRVVVARGERQ